MNDEIEQIFREVAMMKPPDIVSDADPFQSEEYVKFVESMVPLCHCKPSNRPCDGVLAGGICDGMVDDPEPEELDWDFNDQETFQP